jgi:3-deoxy-D-manno-octulosonic-acid transferase
VTLLGSSWRLDYRRPRGFGDARLRGSPGVSALYSFWHGRQLPLIHTHRRRGITVLVSRHRDGEYVASVLEAMGFPTVRGSTTRGGAEALRSMASLLRRGVDCAMTPDGPRGPAGVAGPGLAHISRLSGSPVIPMGTSGWPCIRMRSWDSFRIPLPLARLVVVEGAPVPPPPRGADPASSASAVTAAMDRVTGLADLLSSPGGRLFESALRAGGAVLGALAPAVLRTRPRLERSERMGIVPPRPDRPLWMHGSSLGELAGLAPLASAAGARGIPVHTTCFTPAGRASLERTGTAGSFAPLDTPGAVSEFLGRVRPAGLLISETELWPCTILETLLESVPCSMINARLSNRSLRLYRLLAGSRPGQLLSCFSAVQCRSAEDAGRFLRLGVSPGLVEVTGDSKALCDPGDPPGGWRGLLPGGDLLVAGSTRPGEEEAVLRAALGAGLVPVIAPRHLDRVGEVAACATSLGFRPMTWSALPGDCDCVVVDVHGILSRLYGLARVAFVGGSLAPFGSHSILEPLLRGVPVVVGPSHHNFEPEVARGLLSGAVSVSDAGGLAMAFEKAASCAPDPGVMRELGASRGARALAGFQSALERMGLAN